MADPIVFPESETLDETAAPEELMAERQAELPSGPLSPGATEAEDEPIGVATPANTRNNTMAFAPTFVRIEDDDPAWVYTDTWTTGSFPFTNPSGGTYVTGSAAGSTAQLTFSGTWVSLGFIASASSGRIEVTLNDNSLGIFDLYRREQGPVRLRFDGLPNAFHTIELTILETPNPFSGNTRVQLDYADYGDGTLLPDGDFEEDDPRVLLSDSSWSTVAYAEASGGNYL
ncbi:MAG: hypothetical protein V2J10_08135, partial [Wenzhouxiangella sp.]|nr:hypothetical protein [Wenzhouxiangella sp.]